MCPASRRLTPPAPHRRRTMAPGRAGGRSGSSTCRCLRTLRQLLADHGLGHCLAWSDHISGHGSRKYRGAPPRSLVYDCIFHAGRCAHFGWIHRVHSARESGNSVFAELGLVAFLFGSVFWAIHLAFRAVVMVSAAEEMLVSGAAPSWYHSWRLFAGLMYGLYMTSAYLSTAAYGGAMLRSGWAGKGWGRTFVVVGLVMAAGFVTLRAFNLPLLVQFMPYAMGLILLRRAASTELLARTVVTSGNSK